MIAVVSEHDAEQLRLYLTHLTKFVKSYSWLINSFVLDFFTENHWTRLPVSWQLALETVEPPELSLWLSKGKISCKEVWPLSLQSLHAVTRLLSLSREPIKSTFLINEFLSKFNKKQEKAESDETHSTDRGEFICKNLDHIFTKHVKPKKQHEIGRLAQVSHTLLKNLECSHIVDVGSGQGHLSRLLSLEYGYKVVTVEAVGAHVAGAEKFDTQAITEVKKRQRKNNRSEVHIETNLSLPKHVVFRMAEPSHGNELVQIVQDAWKESIMHTDNHFGLIGLHTCGDLAADMLKLFMETKYISSILSVGCCYMKLDLNKNYPLSDFLKENKDSKLSYEAMEIGCHAIETYVERLKRNADALKIHCYRATLETLIIKHYPGRRHVGLHSVRRSEKMSFPTYVQYATKRVNLDIPYEETTTFYINKCLHEWKRVVVFYSLRLLLAPVIETLVLLDRLMFLYERGYPCILIPLFDPALSPRNHLLVGVRPSPHSFTKE